MFALPFVAALFAPWIANRLGSGGAWLLALVPAAIFVYLASYIEPVSQGAAFTGGYQWIPSIGVNLSYYIDGLSLVFGLLISGIGTFIILYSGGYLAGHPQLGRFLSFMFLFMGSMLGLVMADNLFALLVLWELTSITSFLLIGFSHNHSASRRAALQALVVTGAGGLALIGGFIVVNLITGMTEMSLVIRSGDLLRESPFYVLALVLVLGGAFTKSAQFPLHFWLPNAMEAPTPVSAYLHSATMVKAGVYLLMRMNPVLGETMLWETVLPVFGAATLLVGTLLAVRQTDLKLMLAYTTVASLGLLVMLTGFGTEKAIAAAVYYLVAHSMFKGALFMVVGTVDHEAGTRDIRKVAGLLTAMPITFAAAALAALSMAGLPPFFGFLAKEEIYAAIAKGDTWSVAITIAAILGNALMLAVAAAVALKPFVGAPVETPKHAHEGPPLLWLGPAVLAIAGLAAAVSAAATNEYFISPMAGAIAGSPVEAYLTLTSVKIGLALALSVLTIVAGILLYLRIDWLRSTMAVVLHRLGWGPDQGFDQFVSGTVKISTRLTRLLQNGRMEFYMAVTFVVTLAAIYVPLIVAGELPRMPEWPQLNFYEWGVILIALVGLIAVLRANDRLTAIVSLGIQGFAVALIFMLFGAPDLSLTQFMVETLSVVILALVMTRLTLHKSDHRPLNQRVIDSSIALGVGAGFGLILLSVTQLPFDPRLSEFFAEHSVPIAHGRNMVNVILVDFRGLDTLGEIAVVMIAGLAVLALIRIRNRRPPEAAVRAPEQASTKDALETAS